jgi:hypothetical protein
MIDFDNKGSPDADTLYQRWSALVEDIQPGLLRLLPMERTQNGGYHVYYRCHPVQRNQKLALRSATLAELDKKPTEKVVGLIETRGEGGFVVCAPSQGYDLLHGDLRAIPTITPQQRQVLLGAAKAQTQMDVSTGGGFDRPGDAYNAATDVPALVELMKQYGWSEDRTVTHDGRAIIHMTRPGKDEGTSATINYVPRCLWVWSTSTEFEIEKAYKPFAVYAVLAHHGDFARAAQDLAQQGYGTAGSRRSNRHHLEADQRDTGSVDEVLALLADSIDTTHLEKRLLDADVLDQALRLRPASLLQLVALLKQRGLTVRFLDTWQKVVRAERHSAAQAVDPEALLAHPDNPDIRLYLPAGYHLDGKTIIQVTQHGALDVYDGVLAVVETGRDIMTGDHTMTVLFEAQGREEIVTAPRQDFAQARTCLPMLAARGAAIYDGNGKSTTRYLSKFVVANQEMLPFKANATRLGVVGQGLVLPGGGIGFDEDVRYVGPAVTLGTDHDIYPATIRDELLTWDYPGTALLCLALSLASPMIARLELRRQPVLFLHGPSNCGKSSVIQFATGVWGDPTERPLRVDWSNTTDIGPKQALSKVLGLPLFFDEVHQAADPKQIETTCYAFANGQARVAGTVHGDATGGEALRGTLFLGGEVLPAFQHAGSANRTLILDGGYYYPLGVPPQTKAGKHRSEHLEAAWSAGSGTFGPRLAERMWREWDTLKQRYDDLCHHPATRKAVLWDRVLAAALAALELALDEIGCPLSSDQSDTLMEQWANMWLAGRSEHDPAIEAFERLTGMLARAQRRGINAQGVEVHLYMQRQDDDCWERHPHLTWETRNLHNQPIAYKKEGDDYWRVPTNTPQFKQEVGIGVVQAYGQTWIERGLVRPGNDGSGTKQERIHGQNRANCILIPIEQVPTEDDGTQEWAG